MWLLKQGKESNHWVDTLGGELAAVGLRVKQVTGGEPWLQKWKFDLAGQLQQFDRLAVLNQPGCTTQSDCSHQVVCLADGNCFFRAVADQLVRDQLPDHCCCA